MTRLVARAESFEKVYTAFQNINFAAFDYNTVKQSLLNYIQLYFPETFNDYIESSEEIAIIESFAYIAELFAYRLDVNAQENFISTAQRRDSILRLAKLVSYKPDRIIPARGLVKILSVSTTEQVIDANNNNLTNKTISWNDPTNANWKDQFILVMNRVLDQPFGSVSPTDRFQIADVLFELYTWDVGPITNGVFPYSAFVSNQSVPMELVPVAHSSDLGIFERRPYNNPNFTILYGSDGLGDASNTTGFFCFTKQGSLQQLSATFDGITPNQTYDVLIGNINETDVWLNNIDPTTGATLNVPPLLPVHNPITQGKTGEWVEVDIAHAQNVIFNTNPIRNKYELETLTNGQIRFVFGDGEFATVPTGTFNIWVRSSLNQDIVVTQTGVVNVSSSFTYNDPTGTTQTFTFTFSLINSLQNASSEETLEHIRVTAPAVYYTQDRMVNAQDYNIFPLQDSSILKLRAINRTFAGDSKYIAWHDPSGSYDNVKIFSDDGIIYFENKNVTTTTPVVDLTTLITTYIEPLLSSTDVFTQLVSNGVSPSNISRVFSVAETTSITNALTPPPTPAACGLYYDKVLNEWFAVKASADPNVVLAPNYPADFISFAIITVDQTNNLSTAYNVTRVAKRTIVQSQTTQFWNTNDANRVLEFDTLRSDFDEILILQANSDNTRDHLMTQNWIFDVLGQETIDSGVQLGLPDINRLSVVSHDSNGDGVPDNPSLMDIINPQVTVTAVGTVLFPIYYIGGKGDVTVVGNAFPMAMGPQWVEVVDVNNIGNSITILDMNGNTTVTVTVKDYVYFSRLTLDTQFVPAATSYESIDSYIKDQSQGTQLWTRFNGRDLLNFAWFHRTINFHLVDPAPSNIIDMFIITKGYFTLLRQALRDTTGLTPIPTPPTPLDLRNSYDPILQNKMISDEVILQAGVLKLLFGSRAIPELQATFSVVRSPNGVLTDNQVKTIIVATTINFFDVISWEFGETFFFTELAAIIHAQLPSEISSVVLVPTFPSNHFGDMFEVLSREDEIPLADITVNQIQIVPAYTDTNLRVNG